MAGSSTKEDDKKTERVLRLWNMLSKGRALSRKEIAQEFQVNERTVSRYFVEIRRYLANVEKTEGIRQELVFSRKDNKYYLSDAENHFISHGELLAICKILLESRAFHKDELTSLLERLLETAVSPREKKEIAECVKNEMFDYVDPKHKAPDMDVLWTLACAVRDHHVVTFGYRNMKGSEEESVPHRVNPLGILFSEYYFYLVGQVPGEDHTRSYRLDRMDDVEETAETFTFPYTERFREGSFRNQVQYMFSGEPERVEFLYYGPSIEAVLDRLPTARAQKEENRFRVTADVAGNGVLMWLLSQGGMVNVLQPKKLRKAWRSAARKILQTKSE